MTLTEETAPPLPRKNLRDTLLDALRPLPGTREFHIHVLQSSPRRNSSLYQFAKPRPRTYVQDVLVLLSEQSSKTPNEQRVLVTAIEANLYHVPSTSNAILYVCKVDSTGQTSGVSPTKALVRAFLNYYADPATRPLPGVKNVWIQLFARAQGQYLFPNSVMWEGKKPLSDVRLCAWWKRMLAQVALDVIKSTATTENATSDSSTTGVTNTSIKAYYILPGYSQLEAEYSLKVVSSDVAWEYGHPYTLQDTSTLPCPPCTSQVRNLGHYIPHFEDDPKSRFLDEIAYTTSGEVKSPVRKRAKTATSVDDARQRETKDRDLGDNGKEKEKDDRPLGELGKVTADEFWERMSFRQECVAGAVTGFFSVVVSTKKLEPHVGTNSRSPLEPEAGQVSSQINKRVQTALTTGVEFSTAERAIKATETLESTIKRLCEGLGGSSAGGRSRTPEPRKRSNSTLLVPPRTPPRNETTQVVGEITPNPFPEPVASLETYQSDIYGSVWVRNPDGEARGEGGGKGGEKASSPAVTVLTARKKKKRGE
jgi:regulator of Ty1 transposition protein 109